MQIKQEGELQLQEQQALGVEAWAAGQPGIGEEPWGLSQLDSGAGDVSAGPASGEWPQLEQTPGTRAGGWGQGVGKALEARGAVVPRLASIWPDPLRSFPHLKEGGCA